MSYGPPRTSTPYGDQDFIKEDQDPPQAMASPRYSIGPAASTTTTTSSDFGGYPSDTQHAQPVKAVVGESGTAAQSQAPPLVMRNLREAEELIKSITPEDRLFLQAWRQDSFYYRIVPLTSICWAAYYYYNKSKGLPTNRISRYILIAIPAYILGKISYGGELRKRLAVSPSNTPFMQVLRTRYGVQSPIAAGEFATGAYGSSGFDGGYAGQTSRDWAAAAGGAGSGLSPAGSVYDGNGPFSAFSDQLANNSGNTSGNNPSKQATSYEELRARNRGLLVK